LISINTSINIYPQIKGFLRQL